MIHSQVTMSNEFQGTPILTGYEQGFYVSILDRVKRLLDDMLSRHSQVLLFRIDVRFPSDMAVPPDNSIFQGFIENYRRNLERQNYDPRYLWVRERSSSKNHHYHCLFLLNGNMIRSLRSLSTLDRLWTNALRLNQPVPGLIHLCRCDDAKQYGIPTWNQIMIKRNQPEVYDYSFQWLSYLAKVTTKNDPTLSGRSWGSSENLRKR